MPLETFTNSDAPLNIKNFSAESPEKEWRPHFNPERDITEDDWKVMTNSLEDARRAEEWEKVIFLASALAIIDQNRIPLLGEKDWERMVAHVKSNRLDGRWGTFSMYAANLARLNRTRLLSEITENDWKKMLTLLTFYQGGSGFATQASYIAVIDPERLAFNERLWEGMIKGLEWARVAQNYRTFAEYATIVATLDYRKIIPLITEEDWQNMVRLQQDFTKGEDRLKPQLFSWLTTLSRYEQKWHEEKQSQLSVGSAPFPETRKF